MKAEVYKFLEKFSADELLMAGILYQERRILTGKSAVKLVEMMKNEGIAELYHGDEWRLISNGDFSNGYVLNARGNIKKLKEEDHGIVFKSANKFINPHYTNDIQATSGRTTNLKNAGEMNELINALPLNRKEVYWTSCVLPQIICGEDFERLHIFLKAAGVPERFIKDRYTNGEIMFLTEYSLKESALEWTEVFRFGGYTPDLVIMLSVGGEKHLIFIEAKMFDFVMSDALLKQLENQKGVAEMIMNKNNILRANFTHVALLYSESCSPFALNEKFGRNSGEKMILWPEILKLYDALKGKYFYEMLRVACDNDQLVTTEEAYLKRAK
ncbi:MAG TPA: hypothetical protein PKK26_14080 [Candidatus Wallbacteria bacterium]|nr:hypothetical protein [Candidatus Wallbacteria bacterium]